MQRGNWDSVPRKFSIHGTQPRNNRSTLRLETVRVSYRIISKGRTRYHWQISGGKLWHASDILPGKLRNLLMPPPRLRYLYKLRGTGVETCRKLSLRPTSNVIRLTRTISTLLERVFVANRKQPAAPFKSSFTIRGFGLIKQEVEVDVATRNTTGIQWRDWRKVKLRSLKRIDSFVIKWANDNSSITKLDVSCRIICYRVFNNHLWKLELV